MLKMLIRMDEKKICRKGRYSLMNIYRSIDNLFRLVGLLKETEDGTCMVYRDTGRDSDFAHFGQAMCALEKERWFMENVAEWKFLDSDNGDDPEDFSVEDLLKECRAGMAGG